MRREGLYVFDVGFLFGWGLGLDAGDVLVIKMLAPSTILSNEIASCTDI